MKYIKRTTLALSLLLALSSCNQDLKPTGQIVKDNAFETIADAEKFANGMNSYFRSNHYGLFDFTGEVQTDMYNASITYGNRNGAPHQMSSSFTSSDYNIRDVWRASYKAILSVNNFLEGCEKIVLKTPAEEATMKAYKGNAYFYRAALYHTLVSNYAKTYNPTTAASDLGVPLVLVFSTSEKPARATVAAVYTQIISDMDQAKTFLADVAGVVRSELPTIDAVKALEARVKLYMQDWAGAATVAGELITSGKYKLANTIDEMNKEWVTDNGTEDIMQMFAALTEYGSIPAGSGSGNTRMANNIYLMFNVSLEKYAPDFIPTKTCIDMYDKVNDIRYASWFLNADVSIDGVDTTAVLLNKFPGNPTLFTAPSRTYAQKAKIFRIGEMYLIQAEALVNSGNAGLAKEVLNALQAARGAVQTEATIETIRTEWAKETIGEGFRIQCMRRWGIGYKNRIPQNDLIVRTGQNFSVIDIQANDPKLIWAIPSSEMQTNENLVQNPSWN